MVFSRLFYYELEKSIFWRPGLVRGPTGLGFRRRIVDCSSLEGEAQKDPIVWRHIFFVFAVLLMDSLVALPSYDKRCTA